MHPSVAHALEEIDAAMFTGFPSIEDLAVFQEYIDRWLRRMPEIRDIHADLAKETLDEN